MKARHDAEIAREKEKKDEEEKMKKQREDDEKRLREKKDREEFHMAISETMTSKLDLMCEILLGKKGREADEGVTKLRVEIGELNKRIQEHAGTSSSTRATLEMDTMKRLRREQEERLKMERRLAALEMETVDLRKSKDDAQAQDELWKEEALRPGSKRTCRGLAATPSPCRRGTPVKAPQATVIRDEYLKEVVERHAMELAALR
ncbi:hypothetical protein CBR_g74650 [Chara braunii]|uniref:Uncharacterized protein n=1 Tax=Chara braunii TaxID=69332 RepID=A0A388KA72_CHABU|nr:hypothetical protein CBR_g74650 [Chara braunii]|eukprot:GBG66962.1 hypothetical protein CBR_g74650 [Chara braunii]